MRAWIWTLVVLIAAVTLALVLREHSGNVVVLVPPYRVSFGLNFAVVAAIVIFIVLYVTLRFISWISGSPERFRLWRGRRAQNRDRALLESGWLNVLEGRYDQAEKD
ncbi:heme biosynthesis protein HemY, partial [Alcaligenaceae bacterium 429]